MSTVRITFERIGSEYDVGTLVLPRAAVETEYGHQLDWEALEERAARFAAARLGPGHAVEACLIREADDRLTGNIILGGLRDAGYFTIEEAA